MKNNQLPHNPARYIVWFRQSQFDLEAAKVSLDNGYYEWTTFQAVQAVEKSLKAIIVHSGVKPPRIHKLQTLMGICNRICPEFKQTKFEFRFLESFTFISRYPFLLPGKDKTPHEIISITEAEKALSQACDFVQKISVLLDHPVAFERDEFRQIDIEEFSEEEINNRLVRITEQLKEEFNPEKIILFGRFAREKNVSKLSTMDILIIAHTDLSFTNRIYKARKATKAGLPIIEPLVYTPDEFKAMTEDAAESFLESAIAEGKVLYSKQ